jgi:anti-sigma factor RsiW
MTLEPSRPAMDCAELARSAEALLDGEFDERERAEAAAHLGGCAACRRMVESLERTRSAVREKLRAALGPGSLRGRAPAALRARISEALDRERLPWWRRALSPLPLAAAAACAAGAALVLYTHGNGDLLADEAVATHSRDLPLEVVAASVGADSVAGWFKGKVDFNTRPPDFRKDDLQLLGARISNIRDRPAAYMRYELRPRGPAGPSGHLGLFIIDDPGRQLASGGRKVQVGPATVRLVNARGYNVAVWRRDEIVYSLVSDLDERALEGLVEKALATPR